MLIASVIATFGFSATYTAVPYLGYISYSKKSQKDYGIIGGVYGSCYFKHFKIEADAEHTYLSYKSYSKYIKYTKLASDKVFYNNNDYKQSDLTAIFHMYIKNKLAFKIGTHSLFIDQKNNNDKYDSVFIAGIQYYRYLKCNAGVDFYKSSYDGYNVKQYSPYVGFNFGNYYSQNGSFYLKGQVDFIHISDKAVTGRQNYRNYEISLSNYIKNWTTTIKADFGKNAYRVANGGFSVYNLSEEYKNSFGINVKYGIDKKSALSAGLTYSNFEENGINADSMVYLLSYTRAF